jgi:hypothetical protein
MFKNGVSRFNPPVIQPKSKEAPEQTMALLKFNDYQEAVRRGKIPNGHRYIPIIGMPADQPESYECAACKQTPAQMMMRSTDERVFCTKALEKAKLAEKKAKAARLKHEEAKRKAEEERRKKEDTLDGLLEIMMQPGGRDTLL